MTTAHGSARTDGVQTVSPWTDPLDPIEGAEAVRVLVLAGYGLNCEAETAAGFRMLGARADIVHFGDVLADSDRSIEDAHIVVFVGGFSFGDHIASGRVFANRVRYRVGDRLARHVDDGGFVLGICNGFQTIVKLGLLPALDRRPGDGLAPQQATLVGNERLGYRDAWVRMRIDTASPCVFTRGATGAVLEAPSRHGEGKLVFAPQLSTPQLSTPQLSSGSIAEVAARIEAEHLVPVRYVNAVGEPTESWPDNPNGSPGGAAGLCDPTGRVFGLMPHPEAYLYPENHPDWIAQRDAGRLPARGHGLGVLANGVRAALGTALT